MRRVVVKISLLFTVCNFIFSCSTYNTSGLEVRKRSRHQAENFVIDLRALKTGNEINFEKKQRADVKNGKSKLEVIKRDPPERGMVEPF